MLQMSAPNPNWRELFSWKYMLFWYVLKNQGGTTFDYALIVKARDRSRTDNLIITNDVLRQLSYAGIYYTFQ